MSQDANGSINDTPKNNKFFKTGGLVDKISKHKTFIKIAVGVGGAFTIVTGIFKYIGHIKDVESGYEWFTEKIGLITEDISRRNMIGVDVAHGLAWSHYSGYHQYVLPGIEKEIEGNAWYKKLSSDDQKKFPKKLYELIPRKCYIDIEGTDDNIKQVSEIVIKVDRAGNKREIKIPIYSIMEGKTKYYCLSNCPYVLKTINNMHDIQSAGVSCSKLRIIDFFWNKIRPVQPFTDDTKLIQLMRFYYALNHLLQKLPEKAKNQDVREKAKDLKGKVKHEDLAEYNGVRGKVKLILLNESENKPSDVLLQAIKEDLKEVLPNQKKSGSLMEIKLMTPEESKDIFYDFDVFVTHSERFSKNEASQSTSRQEIIKDGLQKKGMNILSEKDCLGKDWAEKLKFAATKCRWIVFVDKEGSNSTYLTSPKVVDSLKSVLESRKVQTVAIVNKRTNLHISDDLRWVACFHYHSNKELLHDSLYKIVNGSEVEDLHDLYMKPGEAAVGLAWGYAVNYLTKVLPGMKEKVELKLEEETKNTTTTYVLKDKLIIVVPKSGLTENVLAGFNKECFHTDVSPSDGPRSYQFNVYKVDLGKGNMNYFAGQYAAPAAVIHEMEIANVLDKTQTEAELFRFYSCVEKIMKILLPDKEDSFQFIFYDDTKSNVSDVLRTRFIREEIISTSEERSPILIM